MHSVTIEAVESSTANPVTGKITANAFPEVRLYAPEGLSLEALDKILWAKMRSHTDTVVPARNAAGKVVFLTNTGANVAPSEITSKPISEKVILVTITRSAVGPHARQPEGATVEMLMVFAAKAFGAVVLASEVIVHALSTTHDFGFRLENRRNYRYDE